MAVCVCLNGVQWLVKCAEVCLDSRLGDRERRRERATHFQMPQASPAGNVCVDFARIGTIRARGLGKLMKVDWLIRVIAF